MPLPRERWPTCSRVGPPLACGSRRRSTAVVTPHRVLMSQRGAVQTRRPRLHPRRRRHPHLDREPRRLRWRPRGNSRTHGERRRFNELQSPTDCRRCRRLRYLPDDRPGIERRRRGRGFTYVDHPGPDRRRGRTLPSAGDGHSRVDGGMDRCGTRRPPARDGLRRSGTEAVPLPSGVRTKPPIWPSSSDWDRSAQR